MTMADAVIQGILVTAGGAGAVASGAALMRVIGRRHQLPKRVEAVERSVTSIEQSLAASNGDPRSISDRLDTVKYTVKVQHVNMGTMAHWLSQRYPDVPPIVLLEPPDPRA